MSNADAGMPNKFAAPAERWLRPWLWMLVGLAATFIALVWARVSTEEQPPIDLLQLLLVTFGVLAGGVAVWQRCALSRSPGLNDLTEPQRSRALLTLGISHSLTAAAVSAVLIMKFYRPDLPGEIGGVLLLWLVAAPWCAASGWRLCRSGLNGIPLSTSFETAVLITEGGLIAFMGAWAFYWAPNLDLEWDSLRLFLTVLAGFCFLSASLVAASGPVRRLAVSGLIALHFAAILSVVIGMQPGPWIVTSSQHYIFGRYLDFMYLNNGYRFYSPEPGPASQLWCRIEYSSGQFHWVKLPDMDERGNPRYPTSLQFTRRLALSEAVARTDPMPSMLIRSKDGEMELAPWAKRRDQHAPFPMHKKLLGEKGPANPLGIPMHPDPTVLNYQMPSAEGKQLLASYAKYLLRQPTAPGLTGKPLSVKIYRVQHRILPAELMAMGVDPRDPILFLPYYVGQFDAEGKLLDQDDPFLYWLLPILREDENNWKLPSPLQK